MQLTVILSSLCKWKRQKMVVFVVKRYAIREAKKQWRYALRKAIIRRYAVRKGGRRHPNKLCSKAKLQIKDLQFKYSVYN